MKRRHFLRTLGVGAASALTQNPFAHTTPKNQAPNILLFTGDDLHCETPGCFGGKLPDLTPNLDFFASQSIRFERAHVNVSICQPSRGILATGRYGHNNGILGFMHTHRNIPTIMERLREAGYFTGILGKIEHSTPKAGFHWDFAHDHNELGQGRHPDIYYQYCKDFFPNAAAQINHSTSWSTPLISIVPIIFLERLLMEQKSPPAFTLRLTSQFRVLSPIYQGFAENSAII